MTAGNPFKLRLSYYTNELSLSVTDLLRDSSFSPEQASAIRAAYQEVLISLSHPSKPRVPPTLAIEIAKMIVSIAACGKHDRAEIIDRLFEELGIAGHGSKPVC